MCTLLASWHSPFLKTRSEGDSPRLSVSLSHPFKILPVFFSSYSLELLLLVLSTRSMKNSNHFFLPATLLHIYGLFLHPCFPSPFPSLTQRGPYPASSTAAVGCSQRRAPGRESSRASPSPGPARAVLGATGRGCCCTDTRAAAPASQQYRPFQAHQLLM